MDNSELEKFSRDDLIEYIDALEKDKEFLIAKLNECLQFFHNRKEVIQMPKKDRTGPPKGSGGKRDGSGGGKGRAPGKGIGSKKGGGKGKC